MKKMKHLLLMAAVMIVQAASGADITGQYQIPKVPDWAKN